MTNTQDLAQNRPSHLARAEWRKLKSSMLMAPDKDYFWQRTLPEFVSKYGPWTRLRN